MKMLLAAAALVLALSAVVGSVATGYAAPVADTSAPELIRTALDQTPIHLVYSESLDESSKPAREDYVVKVTGPSQPGGASQLSPTNLYISGHWVVLHPAYPVAHGDVVTVTYTPGANPVRDLAGNPAAPLADHEVSNGTPPDSTPPELITARVGEVDGLHMKLYYDEYLRAARLAKSDFVITVNGTPQAPPLGAGSHYGEVYITLAARVYRDDIVTITYSPGAVPIEDVAGNDAASFTDYPVINWAPERDTDSPFITSAWGRNRSIHVGYSEWIAGQPLPSGSNFSIWAGGVTQVPVVTAVVDTTVYLSLPSPLPPSSLVVLTYTPGPDPVRDWAGNEARSQSNVDVQNYTPPDTSISSGPSGAVSSRSASFGFAANAPSARFQCSLDGAAYTPCSSPHPYTGLSDGTHTFRVRAYFDISGEDVFDPSPSARTWTIDTIRPAVSTPVHTLASGSQLGASWIPLKLGWSGTDDRSGIRRYEVQRRRYSHGAWGAWAWVSRGSTETALTRLIAPGTHQFRVRAVDRAGNWSLWRAGSSFTVVPYQETSTAAAGKVSYTGAWSIHSLSSHYGGSTKYARAKDRAATFTFAMGKQVGWVAPKGPGRGYAYVYLDGAKVATVNLYSSSAQYRQVVFAKSGLDPSVPHTLRVYVPGTKPTASGGTRVDIDAFVVLR